MAKPGDKSFQWILPWILSISVTWFSRVCNGQDPLPSPVNGITINLQATEMTVTLGDTLTIQATYQSTPNANYITWYKTDDCTGAPPYGNNPSSVYFHDVSDDFTGRLVPCPPLVIRNITCNDSGNYFLFVINPHGYHYSRCIKVCVTVPPDQLVNHTGWCCYHAPFCTPPNTDIAAVEFSDVILDVRITSNPELTFAEWTHNGNPINDPRFTWDVTNPSLEIVNVQRTDEGIYEVSASNEIGSFYPHNCTYNLTVYYCPGLNCSCNSTECHVVNEGESCYLPVISIDALPPVTYVQWFKGRIPIITGGRFQGGTIANPSLTVGNSIRTDTGNYDLTVRNNICSANCSCCCTIHYRPLCTLLSNSICTHNEGSTFTINVTLDSVPPAHTVDWLHNGVPVNRTLGVFVGGNSYAVPSLTFVNVTRQQTGTYILRATNIVGDLVNSTICRSNCTIHYRPLCTLLSPPDPPFVYNEGATFTIRVNLDSVPPAHTVDWLHNGVPVNRALGVFVGGNSYAVPSLTFVDVTRQQTGIYILRATNIVGDIVDSTICRVNVTIHYLPDLCPECCPRNYTVCEDAPVTMLCTAVALPPINRVTWRKNGLTLDVSDPRYGGGNVSTPSLTIYGAVPEDQGSYECEVGNIVGSSVCPIFLEVFYKPAVFVPLTEIVLIEGKTSSLGCSVDMRTNPPPVVVHWFKNGIRIDTTSERYQHGDLNVPSLTINNIQRDDAGIYSCGAINSIGDNQSRDIIVTVEYPPVVVAKYNNYGFPLYTNATLWCSVDANPPVTPGNVTWVRDGLFTLPSSYCSDVRPNVRLCNVQAPAAGVYRCRAIHRLATRHSQNINVTVRDDCPIIIDDVRLTGESTSGSGRVEVRIDQTWGTVCGKYWTQGATDVVCRLFGYSTGISIMYGGGSGPIHIGHVNCESGATTLGQCSLTSIGNCTHDQDIWVVCDLTPPNTGFTGITTITTLPPVCTVISTDRYLLPSIVLGILLGLSMITNFAFSFYRSGVRYLWCWQLYKNPPPCEVIIEKREEIKIRRQRKGGCCCLDCYRTLEYYRRYFCDCKSTCTIL